MPRCSATSAICENDPKNAWVRYQLRRAVRRPRPAREGGGRLPAGADRRHPRRVGAQRARRGGIQARRSRESGAGDSRRDRAEAGREARPLQSRADRRGAAGFADGDPRVSDRDRDASRMHSRRRSTSEGCTSSSGKATEQEAAFRKAIEINPRFAEGYFYLAKLLSGSGTQFRRGGRAGEAGP